MAPDLGRTGEVELVGTSKLYGNAAVVDNIDLHIRSGEFFSILGPSGSGKTTTMMMVAGFVSPTRGQIRIDGREVTQLPPQHRGLGVVFQNYALFSHMSVAENIAFPLRVRGMPKQEIGSRVREMMELVDLGRLSDRYPRQLSGGQQQRVALARALVFQPRLLLMDEPLGALDKKLRDHMRHEISRIHRHLGVTIIYVTHDQDEALTMSDRIAVMRDGKVEQCDAPDVIYERPSTEFVAGFIGEMNILKGKLLAAEGETATVESGSGKLAGIVKGAPQRGDTVAVAVRPERIMLSDRPLGDENEIRGVLRGTSYGGATVTYQLGVGEETVHCRLPVSHARTDLQTGTEVFASWQARNTMIYTRPSGQ